MTKLNIIYRSVNTLTLYADNAKTHSPEQVGAIARSITEFGFTNPVLIDADGEIIAGHGRVLGARLAGISLVPCIVLADLTDDQKRAYRIADNKIHELGGWDLDKLASELRALDSHEFDLDNLGFDPQELGSLLDVDAGFLPDNPTDSTDEMDEPSIEESDQPDSNEPDGDHYSNFSCEMLDQNKLRLIEVLNDIMKDNYFERTEEALMELVRLYEL